MRRAPVRPSQPGRRFARRSVALTVLAVLLAAGGGAFALVSSLTSSSSTPASVPSSVTSTTVSSQSPSSVLAAGPDQSRAPNFPITGGAELGYGNFNSVACPTATECLKVGADDVGNGTVATSSDGGSSWASSKLPAGTPELDAVACSDASDCVAVGRGAIARSSDGGATWALVALPIAQTTAVSVTCSSGGTCLAAGVTSNRFGPYVPALLRTTDDGTTWTAESAPTGSGGVGAIACPTSTTCIAVGAGILVSHDGGQTWSQVGVPNGTQGLRSISCSGSSTCIAVGPNPAGMTDSNAKADAVHTTDGGSSWQPITLPDGSASVDLVLCSSATRCLATGPATSSSGPPVVYESSDGGNSWAVSSSVPGNLSAIASLSCPSPTTCAAIGRQSDLAPASAATSDGTTWTGSISSGFTTPPNSAVSSS